MRFQNDQLTDVTRDLLSGVNITQVPGFNRASRELNAIQQVRIQEAAKLWLDFKEGRIDPDLMRQAINPTQEYAYRELQRRAPHVFLESMTSGDFTALSTYTLDRLVYQRWLQETNPIYTTFSKVTRGIRDFRLVDRWWFGDGAGLWSKLKERETHTKQEPSENMLQYRVYTWGKGFSFSWEAAVNDLMGLFTDLPTGLVVGGLNTLNKWATELVCDASGPHASMFTAGNANIVASNPVLVQSALQTAIAMLFDMDTPDTDANPMDMSGVNLTLMVGSGEMMVKAMNIKNALFGELADAPGSTTNILRVRNWTADRFNVVFNPWIRKIAGTTVAGRAWWIFMNGPMVTRPPVEIGFLQGFDSPQLFRKSPNTERLGGGVVPELGDFETRANEYKGMMVFGGTRINAKAAIASFGTAAP